MCLQLMSNVLAVNQCACSQMVSVLSAGRIMGHCLNSNHDFPIMPNKLTIKSYKFSSLKVTYLSNRENPKLIGR